MYNHGYPGFLKTAIDAVEAEWRTKPGRALRAAREQAVPVGVEG